MQTILLMCLVSFENGSPFVDAEIGMRRGDDDVVCRNWDDEGTHGLVELVDPVVSKDWRGWFGADGEGSRTRSDLVL